MNIQKLSQDLTLIFGEISEQFFFQLREIIINAIEFTYQQIKELTDHPTLQNTIIHHSKPQILNQLKELEYISQESLFRFLYLYAELLRYVLNLIKPIEKKITLSLYENIQPQVLFSERFFSDTTKDRILLLEDQNVISPQDIYHSVNSKNKNKIYFLLPPLLSDAEIFEQSIVSQKSIGTFLRENQVHFVKVQFQPKLSLSENAEQLYEMIKLTFSFFSSERESPKISFLTFSTGSWILYYLLLKYKEFFKPKIENCFVISSPDLGFKLERILLWAGLGFDYESTISLKILRLLTSKELSILKDFHENIVNTHKKQLKEILPQFPITKIYSIILEENTLWANWLGDGIIEESSLSFFDDCLPEDKIYTITGISHLQILSSFEIKNVLKEIL
ncbi:MAG: hypothetical protein NZ853_10660 [Leptospiraceae bacterium]|nr:hypothetical protein [Leptospiraceae bacterium]MDW7977086.1 hypothetical protein [Leptospiraceae bacterium]